MNLDALRRRALLLGLLTAPLAPASAQLIELDMTTAVLDHPAGVLDNATAVALGRFSLDAIPDAAVLHGDVLYFLYAPDRRNAWSTVAGSYNSIVTLPGINDIGRDGVLATTSAGLSLLSFDTAAGTLVASAVSGTSTWADATDLQVLGDLGGTWKTFALDSDGDTILCGTWDPSVAEFTDGDAIPVEPGTLALAAFQQDDDTAFEFAVADVAGMTFYDDDRTILHHFPYPGADPLLIAVRDAGATDLVAWMNSPTSTLEQLVVAHSDFKLDSPLGFGNVDVKQMALVDLGGDNRKELWLTSKQFPFGIGLRRGSSNTFMDWMTDDAYYVDLDVENSVDEVYNPAFGTGAYGGENDPPVAAAMDLDGDGDDDLFLAGHPNQADRALVCFGKVYDEEANFFVEEHVRPWMWKYTFQVAGEFGEAQSGTLQFPLPVQHVEGPATGATHVRFAVWIEPPSGGAMTFVSALEWAYQPMPPPPLVVNLPNLDLAGQDAKIHIEVSYLSRDTTGLMTWAGPALHERVTVDLNDQSLRVFYDRIWQIIHLNLFPGTSTGGSGNRPPISPPTGGGTP